MQNLSSQEKPELKIFPEEGFRIDVKRVKAMDNVELSYECTPTKSIGQFWIENKLIFKRN